ncbi:CcmD family protein [Mesobacillus maritimus]|nr:CcmD family protein [Mesobacillus maritimus]MCM3587948.1 CcmD family protein [Mesobacillus maritimus]MCM3670122.1 CcmD family protein [Mesobacillus maritimus]
MTYLLMGYSVIFALIAGYMMILGKRQKQIEKEIKQLEEWNQEI